MATLNFRASTRSDIFDIQPKKKKQKTWTETDLQNSNLEAQTWKVNLIRQLNGLCFRLLFDYCALFKTFFFDMLVYIHFFSLSFCTYFYPWFLCFVEFYGRLFLVNINLEPHSSKNSKSDQNKFNCWCTDLIFSVLLEKTKMALNATFIFVSKLLQKHQVKSSSTSTYTPWSDNIYYFISSQIITQLPNVTYFFICWWYVGLCDRPHKCCFIFIWEKSSIMGNSLQRDKESEYLWLPKFTMEQASEHSLFHHSLRGHTLNFQFPYHSDYLLSVSMSKSK